MTGESTPARPVTPALGVLLAVRFVLELALLTAYAVIGVRLVSGIAGWVLGAVLVLLVATAWGQFLSPRRRRELGLGRRVVLELLLYLVAGAGLAVVRLPLVGLALVLAEVVVLGLLRRPGEQVGTARG